MAISVIAGARNTYLAMDIDYLEHGKCKISVPLYTQEIIDTFLEAIMGTSATPAADHLFRTREGEARKLPKEQAVIFHRSMVQLLF